jgi:hypothetical protein
MIIYVQAVLKILTVFASYEAYITKGHNFIPPPPASLRPLIKQTENGVN